MIALPCEIMDAVNMNSACDLDSELVVSWSVWQQSRTEKKLVLSVANEVHLVEDRWRRREMMVEDQVPG
jgi:hypothetical protein